ARGPGRGAWRAGPDRNGMRALPECRNEGPGSRRYGLDAVNEGPGTRHYGPDGPDTSRPDTSRVHGAPDTWRNGGDAERLGEASDTWSHGPDADGAGGSVTRASADADRRGSDRRPANPDRRTGHSGKHARDRRPSLRRS